MIIFPTSIIRQKQFWIRILFHRFLIPPTVWNGKNTRDSNATAKRVQPHVIIRRDVGSEGGGSAVGTHSPSPHLSRSVHPITTRGEDYTFQLLPLPWFSDLPTSLIRQICILRYVKPYLEELWKKIQEVDKLHLFNFLFYRVICRPLIRFWIKLLIKIQKRKKCRRRAYRWKCFDIS